MGQMENNVFKPELWSKELRRDIMDYGVMFDCVNRNWEGEIKNQGDTVYIQKIGDITVNTHSENEPLNYQELDGESLILKIDQAKNFGFHVSDIDKVQSNIELMSKYTSKAKKEVVNVKDDFIHTLGIAGVAERNQMDNVLITAKNIYDTLVDMFVLLSETNAVDKNGLGADGKRPWLVLPPKIVGILRKSDHATHATNYGDTVIRKGTILPDFAGFDIKQATTIKNAAKGNAESYNILGGTTEGITYAEQITKVESVKDKDYFGDFVRGLYLYGSKVVEPECLVSANFVLQESSEE